MKCPRCNGNGSVPYPIDYEQGLFDETNCPLCGGSGEVLTNEEWFESLTTEKKAKIIKMVINTCTSCKEHKTVMTRGCLLRQNMAKNLLFLPCMDEDGICEWLKETHK